MLLMLKFSTTCQERKYRSMLEIWILQMIWTYVLRILFALHWMLWKVCFYRYITSIIVIDWYINYLRLFIKKVWLLQTRVKRKRKRLPISDGRGDQFNLQSTKNLLWGWKTILIFRHNCCLLHRQTAFLEIID